MATSCDTHCDVCDERHITKPAEHWCPECEEGFCSDCLEPHSKMKLTKGHEVISIDSYKQLPSSLPKLTRNCDEHGKEYHIYCPNHECLCCAVCALTTHKECTGLMAMDEAIKSSKTSVSLETLESALTNIETNMKKAQTDREVNIANIVEQSQEFHEEIKKRRGMLNSHLDQIEEKIHGEVSTEEGKVKSQIQDTLQKITKNKDKVKMLQQNLLAVKKYGSDIQTFLWSRTLEAEMIKQEKFIKSLAQDGSLQQINLQLEFDTKISDLSSIPVFGTVSTQIHPQSIVLKTDRDKQAQIMSTVGQARPKKIKDINVTLKSKFNVPTGIKSMAVCGSVICPNGKMIFADDHSNRLVIMNENGTQHKEITISGIADGIHDVTNIDDRTVAVTTFHGIQIVDLDTKKVKELIKTKGSCFGTVHHGGYLFWCDTYKGIHMVKLSSMNISKIVGREAVSNWSYIAACDDKLYVTNMDTNAVTCYSTKGEKIWECKSQSINTPRCITVDTDSNVYVASTFSIVYDASTYNNSITIISPDGKDSRTLLSMTDIKSQVWGIHYDKMRHNLLVSLTDGSAYLYTLI